MLPNKKCLGWWYRIICQKQHWTHVFGKTQKWIFLKCMLIWFVVIYNCPSCHKKSPPESIGACHELHLLPCSLKGSPGHDVNHRRHAPHAADRPRVFRPHRGARRGRGLGAAGVFEEETLGAMWSPRRTKRSAVENAHRSWRGPTCRWLEFGVWCWWLGGWGRIGNWNFFFDGRCLFER